MGIKGLWKVLEPAFSRRVTVDQLASDFYVSNSRSIRLAIDAYTLIFRSNIEDTPLAVRTFMSKVLYLVSLNITFVVVFDGRFKPNKLRNGDECASYRDVYQEFSRTSSREYSEEGTENQGLLSSLKDELSKNHIDWLQAPGEGEAECASIQKWGVVDYVVSDDVDTLVFGATRVLRNLRRSVLDDDIIGTKPHYYVTPVSMEQVQLKTGLTLDRLVFLAVLSGGDYSNGAEGIGIENATKIALCGTSFHEKNIKKDPKLRSKGVPAPIVVDFAFEFTKCFEDTSAATYFNVTESQLLDSHTQMALQRVSNTLNAELRRHSRSICGRLLTLSTDIVLSDHFSILYLFPVVHPSIYKFLPGTLSCGDLKVKDDDLSLLSIAHPTEQNFTRINQSKLVGTSIVQVKCHDGVKVRSQVFIPDESIESSIPSHKVDKDYNWYPHRIIIKLLTEVEHKHAFAISKSDIKENVDSLMVKYDLDYLREIFTNWKRKGDGSPIKQGTSGLLEDEKQTASKNQPYVWLPRALVEHVNRSMVEEFDLAQRQRKEELSEAGSPSKRRRVSPKKLRYPPQKSNLFSYSNFQAAVSETIQVRSAPVSPLKLKYSPRKQPTLPRASSNVGTMGHSTFESVFEDVAESRGRSQEVPIELDVKSKLNLKIPDLGFSKIPATAPVNDSDRDESPTRIPKKRRRLRVLSSQISASDAAETDQFGEEGDTTVLEAASKDSKSLPIALPRTKSVLDEIAGEDYISDLSF